MIYLTLMLIFFRVGLFTFGGGLAALPLLYDEMVTGGYVTGSEFIDMVAVSQSTPGSIGMNMATYVGFKLGGVAGSVIATFAMCTPAFIIVLIISWFIRDFDKNYYVRSVFTVLRGISIGLICAAAWFVFSGSVIDISAFPSGEWFTLSPVILFLVMLPAVFFFERIHPVFFIAAGAAAGIFFL